MRGSSTALSPPPVVVWLTGLPCSGKSTVAALVAQAVRARGREPRVLDGDALRRSVSADLDYSPAARVEQARRAARLALDALEAGALPIVAIISPSLEARAAAAAILGERLAEIHVDAPVAVCERRDVKGLYARARRGEITDFTGVSAPYEPPPAPALRLDTAAETPAACAQRVVDLLVARSALDGDGAGRAGS
jgi:adenylyl-sulfate kinase